MGTEDNDPTDLFRKRLETEDESRRSDASTSQLREINLAETNTNDHTEPGVVSESGPELSAGVESKDFLDDILCDVSNTRGGGCVDEEQQIGMDPKNPFMESENGRVDENQQIGMDPKNPFTESANDDVSTPTKKLKSLSPSYSCASISSEDLFQADTNGLRKSTSRLHSVSSTGGENVIPPASKDDLQEIFGHRSCTSSELIDIIPFPSFANQVRQKSPTQSPPIQVMDRSETETYDPERIPDCVFDGNASGPLGWSTASTESLFSIQLGDTSFSRDSSTLGSEQLKFSPGPPVPETQSNTPEPETETDKDSVECERGSTGGGLSKRMDDMTDVTKPITEGRPNHEMLRSPSLRISATNGSNSNGSVDSSTSFAFPVGKEKKKKKKCACPSSYCSNCSCTFCCHGWRWPSCFCCRCSWAFCYSWNCSFKRWCCHSCLIFPGRMKDSSGLEDAKKATKVKSKSSCCSWFSCCFPRSSCCHFNCCSSCSSCCHFNRCSPCSSCCQSWRCCSGGCCHSWKIKGRCRFRLCC